MLLIALATCISCGQLSGERSSDTQGNQNRTESREPDKPSQEPLVIYIAGPFTGQMPFLAEGIFDGAQVFVDETNKAGGLLGRPLKIVKQDDKADIETASINARIALADPNHLVTIGHPFSSVALPVGNLYNAESKLFFTTYATNEAISKIGGTVFQLCANDRFQGETLAHVAIDRLKAKRIFILVNQSDPYSIGLSEIFRSAIRPNQNQQVALEQYDYVDDKLDISDLKARLETFGPDLVFYPELKVKAAATVRNLDRIGLGSLKFLGSDGWGSEEGTIDIFFGIGAQPANKSYLYTYHWHPHIDTPQNKQVMQSLHKGTGKAPYSPGVLTYEALLNLREVINKNRTIDNAALARLLRGSTFNGVSGPVHYRTDGVTVRDMVLIRLTQQGLALEEVVKPAASLADK